MVLIEAAFEAPHLEKKIETFPKPEEKGKYFTAQRKGGNPSTSRGKSPQAPFQFVEGEGFATPGEEKASVESTRGGSIDVHRNSPQHLKVSGGSTK